MTKAVEGFNLFFIIEMITNIVMHTNSYAWEHYSLGPIRVKETKTIAKLQIYVERAMQRPKEFHIFDSDIPLNTLGSVNQIYAIAHLLTNFQGPLIKED